MHCVLGQNGFWEWRFCVLFMGVSISILRQNAFRFAAKRFPFCGKTLSILRQNAKTMYS